MELYQYQESDQAQHIYDEPRQAACVLGSDTAVAAGCSSSQDCPAECSTRASSEKQLYVNISQSGDAGMIAYLSRKYSDCYDNGQQILANKMFSVYHIKSDSFVSVFLDSLHCNVYL